MDIWREIEVSGFAVSGAPSLDAFLCVCESLGEVLSVQDVALVQGSARHVSMPAMVPFHTDGPDPDVVAWYCLEQDEDDGTSLLVDAAPLVEALPESARRALATIQLPFYAPAMRGRPAGYAPVLSEMPRATWRINYASWLLPPLDDEQRSAVARLDDAVARAVPMRVRLSAGQCLFVDNWRVMHGRAPLRIGSTRLLKRAWIRTPRESRASAG